MELCARCSSITLCALRQDLPASLASRSGSKQGMVLREDGSTLARSATDCRLCALIQEALSSSLQSSVSQDDPQVMLSLAPDAVVLEPKSDSQGSTFPDPPTGGSHLTGFNVTATELITGQPLQAKIRLYTHGQRSIIDESQLPQLPSRVIQVSGSSVRLLPSGGRRGRYAALSHCWGSSGRPPLKTTQANLQKHLQDIPWASIPKTFQDAITVARSIGLAYVWIDSLCIVQDDHQDWLKESKRMGSIYEQAELTIAASHTPGCWEGFLFPRRPPPPSVEIPSFFSQDTDVSDAPRIQVFATVRRDTAANTFPEFGTLNSRAWATQEWLLSRRIVFFTKGAIIWSCKAITQRETGERCYSISRNTRWKNIIEQYSDRQLTYATDRLIALEGLRMELGKKIACEYAFGVWKESLPNQLLWQVTKRIDGAAISDPLKLPTWTWAHVPCGVRFLAIDKAKNLCSSVALEDNNLKRLSLQARAKRISVVTTALGSKQGDAVTEAIYADINTSHAKLTSSMAKFILAQDGSPIGWAVFDLASEDITSGEILAVALMGSISRRDEEAERRLGKTVSKKLRHYWVLIIRQRSDGRYHRIGVGKTYGQKWWQDAAVGTFNLV
ncbi:heterokaryon incompatibility protein (HET) domain-containing protein [Trichoderma breve]|uniref:Heterokaryon incompatibility protein (HET) domain-containing protein n=1 Tax=Trichoderma breve TaxID=2034170 RepID=A0A9W9BDS7_9HYPO|nr:heterokaryon incompatibility protein (HET) domain-containing protein [Trichoderma breve]KAJ4857696.1 heterokaryon incompatibility protein (HET) domain-containing protein [Trichoderma breve]